MKKNPVPAVAATRIMKSVCLISECQVTPFSFCSSCLGLVLVFFFDFFFCSCPFVSVDAISRSDVNFGYHDQRSALGSTVEESSQACLS